MANLTTVTLTSGVPTAGNGIVSTLDNIIGTAGTGSAQVLTVQGNASGTAIPVSLASVPSHAVTNAGTFAVQVTSAPTTAVTGTFWQTTQPVSLAASVAVTNAGTFAVQVSNANANGSATSANSAPVVIASDQAAVTTQLASTANIVSGVISTAMTGTTSTSLVAAPGSSLRNYITTLTISNSHATVGTDIVIQDGSGGTTIWVVPAAAAYGGAVIIFDPPLRQPTANTALFAANVTTGSSTKVSANGFKAA